MSTEGAPVDDPRHAAGVACLVRLLPAVRHPAEELSRRDAFGGTPLAYAHCTGNRAAVLLLGGDTSAVAAPAVAGLAGRRREALAGFM